MRSGAIIYPLLRSYGSLTELVESTKFFAVRAQQPTTTPYLVYREISSVPLNTKGDSQDNAADPRIRQRSILDTSRVQISVFGDTYLEAENIAVKVREALDREWGTVISPYENDIYVDSLVYESCVDDYDDDAGNRGVYVKHLDFIIRINRLHTSNTWTNTYSLAFDGVDDYVTFGDNSLWSINGSGGNRGFSLSVWVKLAETTDTQFIINKDGFYDSGSNHYEYQLLNRFNDQIRFVMKFGDTNTNYINFDSVSSITPGAWTHIVITYDLSGADTGLNMYINNVLKNTTNSGATVSLTGSWGTPADTACPVYMGRSAGADYTEGNIDEFSIWDEVLSADDVSKLYGSGSTGDPNRYPVASDYLVGFWRNGDGATYPTIPDASPNYSNDGTMTNMSSDDIVTAVPG
jgi:hypothetical protein